MKVLFFMRHPGYVRNFEAVIAELTRRDHDVHVAFDSMNTKWMADADPLGGLSGNDRITFDQAPRVRTGWQQLGVAVRSCDDYLRYQRPEYANAPKLRKRAEARIPARLRPVLQASSRYGSAVQAGLRALDRSMPVEPRVEAYIRGISPDVVLVTPLVGLGSTQADYVKAARAVGCPAGLCVASWDNLTNKGLIREDPDLVAVWNEAQRREAIELHGTPPERIAVTGAHSYDHWFWWRASSTRDEFCSRVGLDPAHPYILYLCSSPFIAPDEHRHVRNWLRALRAQPHGELQEVGVLIRPHPQNADQWAGADLSDIGNVTVYPPAGADPVDRRRKDEYFDAIHHAALVVGVNTSAQIESAIVGRSVFSLLVAQYGDTQRGTLHFEHLAADEGGLLFLADTFEEHALQLVEALRDPAADDIRRRGFLKAFVRPFGLDEAGTPRLAGAIERAAQRGSLASPGGHRALTLLMTPVALLLPGGKHSPLDVSAQATRVRRRLAKRLRHATKSAHAARRSVQRRVKHLHRTVSQPGRRRLRRARRQLRQVRRILQRTGSSATRRAAQLVGAVRRPRAGDRDPQRRVLFFLNYAGYLRYFDGVIAELAERGNSVLLVLDRPDTQTEGLRALDAMPDGVRVVGTTPRREDVFGPLVRGLRGTIDYARYLHPRFRGTEHLRSRRRKALDLAPRMAPLGRVDSLPASIADLLVRALRAAERAIPRDEAVTAFVRGFDPDLVVVSPLVSEASPQTDVVKSAQGLGIPTAVCVASWDHLTTKGLVRVHPERVIVWNETQAREARELHDVSPERIAVTGAQPFDRWFDRRPHDSRERFCARVGLPADRPYILFVGSTAGISRADHEEDFVRRWIAAVRSSDDAVVRDAAILIRPHPYNPGSWADADVTDLGHVAIWPRHGANPVEDRDRRDYFDSMYHSAAVVGINTSAMIESAIVGRPVHTIRTEDFARTQGGTLHFHYLLPENGGFLRVATSLDEHLAQLGDSVRRADASGDEIASFIRAFLRPHGLERSCAPIVADELESLSLAGPTRPTRVPRALLPLTVLLYAGAIRRRYVADGALLRDTMIAARRASRAVRSAERRSRSAAHPGRFVSRSLAAARELTLLVEHRASRRYREIVPKVSPASASGEADEHGSAGSDPQTAVDGATP